MLILSFDTTAVTASVCVAQAEDGIKKYSLFSTRNKLKHSENLMVMVDAVLKSYGAEMKDIGLIGCSVGPGSFTGVRIGVATAKGLAFAMNTPCAAVSALDALAENLSHVNGLVCPLMDARRNQFYNALYYKGKRLTPDRAIGADELSAELDKYPEVTLCGDGAGVFLPLYGGKARLITSSPAANDQNALSVAAQAYKIYNAGNAVTHEKLNPVYLRPSQAERNLNV